ncbi:MAG: 4Fe-4S binding protein [Deltaproteobacteria bacterium]|jgi:dissimilatory sulfite reductase (desulfoviridin) alpha/beta subunit|nr:4Fe-4S binding protein [Deltaproteobacteria bacterium]
MAVDYKALKNNGFMRQKQKDRFSMRLKVVGGHLTTDQLRTIADAADTYGKGIAHLTSRQGVEIPYVKLSDIEKIKEALAAGGVSPGVCGAAVRTVTACQGSKVCPSGCIDTYKLAKSISERYYGKVLPHKFKFGVTGCMNNCLKAEENDVGVKGGLLIEIDHKECTKCALCVKVCREKAISLVNKKIVLDRDKCNNCGRCVKACPTGAWVGTPGYMVYFGGTFGNKIAKGEKLIPILENTADFFKAADAAIEFFIQNGKGGERLRAVIERTGWEPLEEALGGEVKKKAKGSKG